MAFIQFTPPRYSMMNPVNEGQVFCDAQVLRRLISKHYLLYCYPLIYK